MSHSLFKIGLPLIGGSFLMVAAFTACGSDSGGGGDNGNPEAGTTGGTSGSGGSTGGSSGSGGTTGGTSGSGGTTGGTGGGGGISATYTCLTAAADPANDPNPVGTSASGDDCCGTFGTCTDLTALSGDAAASFYGYAGCGTNLACAPKDVGAFLDGGMLPTCSVDYGTKTFEGRCLPACFTLGDPAASSLTVGDCPAMFGDQKIVCAPCYNPIDGTATGACTRNGDMPTMTTSPGGFAECGSFMGGPMLGYCVPADLVAATGADPTKVPQDTCAMGELCAPKTKVEDPSSCFAACAQSLDAKGEGGCVPNYLAEFGMMGAVSILQGTTMGCPADNVCAPCVNPTTMASTGACEN